MRTKKHPSLKPRKIPQQLRAEKTVAAILDAAASVMESEGVDGLNTNVVARCAGISVGSLYQYFPGKDALIVALSLRERAIFLAEAEGALSELTGRRALQHLVTVSVRHQLLRPALARLLDFEEARPLIARELVQSTAAFRQLICNVLTREDIPPVPDVEVAASELAIILRAVVEAAGFRGEVDAAGLEARTGLILFRYLGIQA